MDKKFISGFFKGIASTSFGTAFQMIFHFLSVALLARYLSKELLGLYFLALVVVRFLNMISGLGLDLTLVKFISSEEKTNRGKLFVSSSILLLIVIFIASLIFLGFGDHILPIFDSQLSPYVALLTFLFVLTSIKDFLLRLLQGLHKFRGYAITQIISAIFRVILLVALRNQITLPLILMIEIVVLVPAFLTEIIFLRGFFGALSLEDINFGTTRDLLKFGFPLYINQIFNYFMSRGPVLLIGYFLVPASVAAYEIALKIPEGFTRLFTSFILVYFPSQSMLFSNGDKKAGYKFMNDTLILISTLVAFAVLGAFLFRDIIVLLVFSEEYVEVTFTFVLLMLSFYMRSISNILGYSIVSAGKSSAPVIANIIATAVNLIGGIIFIRTYGYIGAAYAAILMNITSQVIYILMFRRLDIKVNVGDYLKPFYLLVLFAGGYYLLSSDSNIFLAFIFLLGFAGLSWVTMKQVRDFVGSAFKFVVRKLKFAHQA